MAAGNQYPRRRERTGQRRSRTVDRLALGLVVGGVIFALLALGPLAETPERVDAARLTLDPVLGNPDAPVTIVEYGAYGCHSCETWHAAGYLDQIMARYGADVRFTFRDFPVISPEYDRMAAELAQCALDQDVAGDHGGTLFWAYHDALYRQTDPGDSRERLISVGAAVGLDGTALAACADAETHRATVDYDEQAARRLGLRGTPSFVVNGQLVYRASPDSIMEAVDAALESQQSAGQ